MADLARISRPWLFSLRQKMRTTHTIAPLYLSLAYGRRTIGTTAACSAKHTGSTHASGGLNISFLILHTIVPPPIWKFPLSPVTSAKLAWLIIKNRAMALQWRLGVYIGSAYEGGRVRWPRFRARKRDCVPAAKVLHAQVAEALAAGDKDTLRRVCVAETYKTLAEVIDARAPRLRTEWALVRYDRPLLYPRIADFRVSYQAAPGGRPADTRLVKQAVVSISSVQRIARYFDGADGLSVPVPGSERVRHLTEHVVLQCEIKDKGDYEAGPWRYWGTMPEMSYEEIRDDTAMYNDAMARPPSSPIQ
ncbi:hypothetical protein GGS24DRAFT_444784 [Hypoxylon argillaceum]|nr:hypothetical protein GGS24DRAFT_444784 [Hypoxylon argillaceum]